MKRKHMTLVAIVGALSIAAIWALVESGKAMHDVESAKFQSESANLTPPGLPSSRQAESSARAETHNARTVDPEDVLETPENVQKVRDWAVSRGYYVFADGSPDSVTLTRIPHPFDSYSDSELDQLSESNVVVAMTMLADRITFGYSQYPLEKALELHKKAIVFGSTASSVHLGNFLAGSSGNSDSGQADEANLVEGLAWLVFSAESGDPHGQITWGRYVKYFDENESLVGSVCAEFDALVEQIASERQRLGLSIDSYTPHPFARQVDGKYGIAPRELCN